MKFTCSKNELIESLNAVSRAVAVKPQMPILAGIYMNAEGSGLELQANNFSMGIITKIPVSTEGEIFPRNYPQTFRRNRDNFLSAR